MQRVVVYIDGFNLYYGLREKSWQRYYWLDVCKLAKNLLLPHQNLQAVRYFTTRIAPDPIDPDKKSRQDTYIEALETLPDLKILYGYYLPKQRSCSKCGNAWKTYEEKMTDVNIAVELLGDGQDGLFDTALVVSGDSDLVGPVRAVLNRYPNKRMVIAFPPARASKALRKVATASFTIGRDKLKASQLPNKISSPGGYILKRPPSWR